MKLNSITKTTTGLLTALTLSAAFAFAPAQAATKDSDVNRVELRIKNLHTKLNITAAQETQWAIVAGVMRDDAKNMDALTKSRFDHSATMTAVDDLKSYGEIATAHAEGVNKLTPVFATLYQAMTPAQQKEADNLFRHTPMKTMK